MLPLHKLRLIPFALFLGACLWTLVKISYLQAIYFHQPAVVVIFLLLLSLSWSAYKIDSIRRFLSRGSWIHLVPILFAFVLIWLLPVQRLEDPPVGPGDSLHLSEFLPVFSELFGYLTTPDELLELFLRSRIYLLMKHHFSPQQSLGLYSYVAGLLHIAVAYWFVSKREQYRIIAWLTMFFTPGMTLYAGYIESYSMARALLFSIIALGWITLETEDQKQQRHLLYIIAALAAMAVAHHLLAGLILPALIFLTYRLTAGNRKDFFLQSGISGCIALLLLIAVFGIFYLSPQASIIFAESHVSSASILPIAKLFDQTNWLKIIQLILIFPVSILWLLAFTVQEADRGNRPENYRPLRSFLWLAFLPFALHAFLWNAAIGFPADWDLFTFFTIPLSVLIFHFFIHSEWIKREYMIAAIASLTLLPALLWMTWLHERSPSTALNEKYIQHVHAEVIPLLQVDQRLAALTPVRQKMYIRLRLFEEKSLYHLAYLNRSPGEQDAIVRHLRLGMQTFYDVMHGSEEQYADGLAAAQTDLFQVYQYLRKHPMK